MMPARKIAIRKTLLKRLYIAKGMSTYKIGDYLGCSASTVESRLEEFGIPKKSASLARMRYAKKDFKGLPTYRAYMIGFRMGDLNVYQTSPHAETVVVRCHTTQQEQVEVLEGLFAKFGKVSTSQNGGHYHVNCFLNRSFSFLMAKDKSVFGALENSDEQAAFTAGYTDAEGNFIINQGRARFKIDSYDKEVLDFIAVFLSQTGVSFKLRRISNAGDTQYIRGVPALYPQDLWRLNINEGRALLRFVEMLKPFLRHRTRIRDMKKCEVNITRRIHHGTTK